MNEEHTPRLHTQERKAQIAQAALELAANGIRAVTVSAVAEAVGVVPSALYRHYKNRNEMLRAAFMHLRSMLEENVRASSMEPDTLIALERFWQRHIGLILSQGAVPRILFSEDVAGSGSPFRDMLIAGQDNLVAGIAAIIARGQEAGTIRSDAYAKDLAILFLGQMLLPVHMHFIRQGEFDLQAQVQRNWKVVRDMLRAKRPEEETA
ncbi:transcriptional regulator, TetR family [Paucidesulfovibrio gracilis DSM 16080]|uniref:Transcriptional regulator, TetR family n=1 Tax=Paucidesulfovibrio gracilis DSM 16080 TaxID=1121449 RepID=A0A1T4WAS6_9BACT|nr:TetR/AcrR family transcriptional regulator [Paucidesulfovibrio gracilis]SKA74390.1 transcriptional regulator, TetR family [Paucidesulfovibrio gracilis DSM 16080]